MKYVLTIETWEADGKHYAKVVGIPDIRVWGKSVEEAGMMAVRQLECEPFWEDTFPAVFVKVPVVFDPDAIKEIFGARLVECTEFLREHPNVRGEGGPVSLRAAYESYRTVRELEEIETKRMKTEEDNNDGGEISMKDFMARITIEVEMIVQAENQEEAEALIVRTRPSQLIENAHLNGGEVTYADTEITPRTAS